MPHGRAVVAVAVSPDGNVLAHRQSRRHRAVLGRDDRPAARCAAAPSRPGHARRLLAQRRPRLHRHRHRPCPRLGRASLAREGHARRTPRRDQEVEGLTTEAQRHRESRKRLISRPGFSALVFSSCALLVSSLCLCASVVNHDFITMSRIIPLFAFVALAADFKDVDPNVFPKDDPRAKDLPKMMSADAKRRMQEANLRESKAFADVTTKEQWEKYRDTRIQKLKESLGTFPEPPKDMRIKVTRELDGDGFVIHNIVYESRPGLWVSANLYLPAKPPGEDAGHHHLALATTRRKTQRRAAGHGHDVGAAGRRGAGARPPRPRRAPAARLPHREGLRQAVPRRPPGLLLPLQLEPATLGRGRIADGLDGVGPDARRRCAAEAAEHRQGPHHPAGRGGRRRRPGRRDRGARPAHRVRGAVQLRRLAAGVERAARTPTATSRGSATATGRAPAGCATVPATASRTS